MVAAVSEKEIPCSVSYSAGTYVCNDLIYHVLQKYEGTDVKACFIHVPFIPEQTEDKPSMELETIAKALEIAKENDCSYAILKSLSPSCSVCGVYDGSFSGKVVDGMGVTARLFVENGIKVVSENEI